MATNQNPLAVKKPLDPMFTVGKHVRVVQAQIVVGSTSLTGDIHVLAKGLPATARIARIMLPKGSSAITGFSDCDFGFYESQTGKVIDKDAIVDGVSFASAKDNVDLVGTSVSDFDATADIATLCGHGVNDIPAYGYDLCATCNTVGTASGTIDLDIVIEED